MVWWDYRSSPNYDIYGQLVNADGTLYGTVSDTNFVISNATDYQIYPSVAYDSENHRFLVVWEDQRNGSNPDVYGQLVNADGTLYGTASDVNFVIASKASNESRPSVAYDSVTHRFLVAWWDYATAWDIYGQLVNANGTLYGTDSDENFVISNATGNQANPAVAYDSANQRFLVAWSDGRNGNSDIYGQLVNAAGTLYETASDTNFVISNKAFAQNNASVAFDSLNQRFLVAWSDYRSGNSDIYGQLVNAAGTLYGTTSDTNFVISTATGNQDYPSVAYNSICSNFMVSYQTTETGTPDIGLALLGAACQYTVTANADGNGSGTVSSDTGGIDYIYQTTSTGTTTALDPGSDVVLTAAAATGSTVSWTTCTGTANGNGTGTATCSYSGLDNDKTAAAIFTLNQYTVTANAGGNGSGAVSSNTGGINYIYNTNNTGTTSALDYGTNVVLTATAAAGSTVSWTTCTGTKAGNGTGIATCTYSSLKGNKTAAATFNLLPSSPSDLTVKPTSSTSLVLGWKDNSDIETGFRIDRKEGACDSENAWARIATRGANVITYTDTGLTPETTYSYKIKSYNAAGNSTHSSCKSEKTGVAGTPKAPITFRAISVSTTKVNLTWNDTSSDETGFKIYRKTDAGAFTLLTTTGMNAVSYSDTTATGNDSTSGYSYYIKACNAAGCSPTTSTAAVPYKPTDLIATPSAGQTDLMWTDNSGNETGFQVYSKDGDCSSLNAWGLKAATAADTYSDTSVVPGTTYSYKVRAIKEGTTMPQAVGYSLYSNCVSAVAE